MDGRLQVRIESQGDSSSVRIAFAGQLADSKTSGSLSGGGHALYTVHPLVATLYGNGRRLSRHGVRRVVSRSPSALSWRAQIARALKEPERSGDVTLVWHSFLDVLARTVPAGRPAEAQSDFSDEEAAVLARGSAGLDVSSAATARALARTAARWVDLLRDSGGAGEAARLLGVQESRVRQRLADRTLYGFKHEGAWRVPRFQYYRDGLVPGVAAVFPRLPAAITPVAVGTWFTTPTMELVAEGRPMSPRDWLTAGGDPSVVGNLAELL